MAASRASPGVTSLEPTSAGNGGTATPLRSTAPTNRGGVGTRFDADTSGLDPNACSTSRVARVGLSEARASPPPEPGSAAGTRGGAR
eukprot:14661967-Alexandrium_andersonii.AAC.1